MIYMFLSNDPSSGDINSSNLPCCSMFCYTLRFVHSSIAIILMGKRELVALLYLSFWCLVMV